MKLQTSRTTAPVARGARTLYTAVLPGARASAQAAADGAAEAEATTTTNTTQEATSAAKAARPIDQAAREADANTNVNTGSENWIAAHDDHKARDVRSSAWFALASTSATRSRSGKSSDKRRRRTRGKSQRTVKSKPNVSPHGRYHIRNSKPWRRAA